jgi:hypothetical protein
MSLFEAVIARECTENDGKKGSLEGNNYLTLLFIKVFLLIK